MTAVTAGGWVQVTNLLSHLCGYVSIFSRLARGVPFPAQQAALPDVGSGQLQEVYSNSVATLLLQAAAPLR